MISKSISFFIENNTFKEYSIFKSFPTVLTIIALFRLIIIASLIK
jgi:flagellar biosynthesis component FlhA